MVALLVFAMDFHHYNFLFVCNNLYNSQSKQLFQNYKSRHRSITHSHTLCSSYNYITVHHKPFRHPLTNWLASPFVLELLMDHAITVPVSFSTVFMRWLLLVCFFPSLMLTLSLAAAVLRIICQNKRECFVREMEGG